MAALKKFVKIKPIETKSSVGINFNEFRKGINRTGILRTVLVQTFLSRRLS